MGPRVGGVDVLPNIEIILVLPIARAFFAAPRRCPRLPV